MDHEAKRYAWTLFRVKMRRDTGTKLTAADCEVLSGKFLQGEGGEQVSLFDFHTPVAD
jgi:hypothetical protein